MFVSHFQSQLIRISGCLADISAWMKEHHLQLNLAKTWASCLPCHSNSTAWFHHPARFFYNYPIKFSQKSWGNFRWPAHFQRPYCKTARSCKFALHNIRKIRPFLTQHAAQLLVQALVISQAGLLQCSSSWTSIMHNQTFTDDSECCSMIGLQRPQKGPCLTSLCLPALTPGCSSHQVQNIDACI